MHATIDERDAVPGTSLTRYQLARLSKGSVLFTVHLLSYSLLSCYVVHGDLPGLGRFRSSFKLPLQSG